MNNIRILLVVYDNGSFIQPFPQGLAYIASALEKAGHKVVVYNQDMHHYPDEHLTEYLDSNKFDVVGVNVIAGYYQYRKLIAISKAIDNTKDKPLYILGGHGPSPDPEYFLRLTKADVVVIGEGEETIVKLLKRDCSKDVKGVAYIDGENKFIQTEKRELIEDIDKLIPAYHLFPIEYYRLQRYVHCGNTDLMIPVLSGRGCLFNCSFCFRLDKGFRPRKPSSIIKEVEYLKRTYNINIIDFSDELLMSSVGRTKDLCNAFLNAKLNIRWSCNGRLNFANKDVLELMKRAGCIYINYGVEAMNNYVLKMMNKTLTTDIIIKGTENTLEAGISPGLNLMWGNIGDTEETLNKAVDFLLKYDDCAQLRTIRFVTPYPGCPLYYYAIKKGLLKDCDDFYKNKHKNSDLLAINFTEMKEEDMYKNLYKANCLLIDNYYKKHAGYMKKQAKELYLERNESFRGFRQS